MVKLLQVVYNLGVMKLYSMPIFKDPTQISIEERIQQDKLIMVTIDI